MMNFKDFINEEVGELPHNFDQLLRVIKNKCSHFVSSTDKPLLRGVTQDNKINKLNNFFIIDELKQNRRPRDSFDDHTFNFYFNLGIESLIGEPNIRHRSLFTTGDVSVSTFYGQTFFVFPQNGYDFIGASKITDSYKNLQELSVDVMAELRKHKSDAVMDIYNFMNGFKAADIFRQKGQITLKEFEGLTNKQSRIILEKSLEHLFKSKYHYKHNTNLNSLIESGSEILFFNTPRAILVNATKLREALIRNVDLVPAKNKAKFISGAPMLINVYDALLTMIKDAK
jgi:hypothetical protein